MTGIDTVLSARGTKLNKKGMETRRRLLEVAFTALASGQPGSVSTNVVVREAGVTWGTVQHQFGDADGLWSAVLSELSGGFEHLVPELPPVTTPDAVAGRVEEVVEALWRGLGGAHAKVVHNLRRHLPSEWSDLETDYPLTAAELFRWHRIWDQMYLRAFTGAPLDPIRLKRVQSMLPAAIRGIRMEAHMSTKTDVNDAKRGVIESAAAYLTAVMVDRDANDRTPAGRPLRPGS